MEVTEIKKIQIFLTVYQLFLNYSSYSRFKMPGTYYLLNRNTNHLMTLEF